MKPSIREPRTYLSDALWRAVVGAFLLASVLIVNPHGFGRAGIWVGPKLTLQLLFLLPLSIFVFRRPRLLRFRSSALLIALFCAIGLYVVSIIVSTITAKNPHLSLFGYPDFPEGAQYFLLMVCVCLGTMMASTRDRRMLDTVAGVIVFVGIVSSVLAIPQKFNWLIDYTAPLVGDALVELGRTSGGVYRHQMPTALTWHRGFMGYLALLGCSVAIAKYLENCVAPRTRIALCISVVVCAMGVVLSDTRTVVLGLALALIVAIILACTSYRRRVRDMVLVSIAVVVGLMVGIGISLLGESRAISLTGVLAGSASEVSSITSLSGRNVLWKAAIDEIPQRPLFGHGYLTFLTHLGQDTAESAVTRAGLEWASVEAVHVTQYVVVVSLIDGSSWQIPLIGTKPHNALLEHLHGVGLFGTLGLLLFFVIAAISILASRKTRWVAVPLVAWIIFSIFWYDSVQFSILNWALVGCALGASRILGIDADSDEATDQEYLVGAELSR